MSKSSVKRAMQELHGQGVVKKEVVGKATLLSVDLKLESFETSHGVKKLQCCDDLSNGVKLNPVQNDPGLKMNPKEREIGVTLAPKKEKFLKKKEDLLLSQKDKGVRGEELKAYFFSLSNSWKLGLEKKAFGQLLELYKEPEILKAFKFLKVQGTVGARKPCDLPLCYLGKSIERVLELASEKESNERKESEVLKDRALQKKLEQRKLQDQEKKFQVALRLFTRKFKNDDEQERAIQQALGEKYPRFQPSGKMRKKLGVMAWVEGECGKNFFHIPESKLQSEVEISEIFREFTVVKNSTESGVL